jgi:hypothetical protein
MVRRQFLKQAGILASGSAFIHTLISATGKENPVLMIVSGWQDVNIGDIAHTPGLIGLLGKRLPKAKIILWKKSESATVDNLLLKHFPALRIVHGQFDKDLKPASEELKQAFSEADFFIHGSGPSVVGADHVRCWWQQTKKGFGIFGVTIQDVSPSLKQLLQHAAFIFTRETASIEVLRKNGLQGAHIAFAPDATFVLDIHNDEKAFEFLQQHNLSERKFICVVPRLRYTPYHQINPNRNGWSDQKIKEVEDTNERYKEIDHAKLRAAMIEWVRKTGNKILVCPEMTYQVEIMDELLIDPLPADVKPHVVKRGYWLPDEAASVYLKAHSVLSFECHSPIIAAANGTPAFYLRQPTDTIKGQMYYDLGFNNWVFEIDSTSGEQIAKRLMDVNSDYPKALLQVKQSIEQVHRRYDETFSFIAKAQSSFASVNFDGPIR